MAENSRVTSTVYHSVDQFKFPGDTAYGWRSTLGTVRWSQAVSRRMSFNLTVLQSEYRFHLDGLAHTSEFVYASTVRQREARLDWLWSPKPTVRVGWSGALLGYRLSPGTIGPSADSSNIRVQTLALEQAREGAAYLSGEWTVRPWLSVQAGLRYAGFGNIGPGRTYRYVEGVPRSEETILDTLSYGKGQPLAKYGGWEPRLSLRIGAGPTGSVKLSYARTRQFLHLISNTTAISPVDFYKVSNALVPLQVADQWAVGYFCNFKNNVYELVLEAYMKNLSNLVEYKNGATLLLNSYLDADLLKAQGRAYGVEASLQKTRGTLTGLIAYIYARTLVRVETPFAREQVNQGEWYAALTDRPHNLTLSTQWKWSRGWTFGTNFTYTSGRPATYPDGTYVLGGNSVLNYSRRNANRLPEYHRLDVSFSKDTRRQASQTRYSTVVVAFYNVYARQNPYSIYVQRYFANTRAYQLSVYGSLIPLVSWTYTF